LPCRAFARPSYKPPTSHSESRSGATSLLCIDEHEAGAKEVRDHIYLLVSQDAANALEPHPRQAYDRRRTHAPLPRKEGEPLMSPEAILERLQCFLKWNAHRTDALDMNHEPIASPACYTRGKGDKLEYWITAETWRTELFPDDEDGSAPKAIASLGLLRLPKEPANFQICAGIRQKITKVYAVRAGILTAKANGHNGTTQLALPSVIEAPLPPAEPLSLAAKLENIVSLSLDEAESILRLRVSPDDRAYQAVLRAKTAVFNGALANQVRIDETKLREAQRADAIAQALAELRAWPNSPAAPNLRGPSS
jgi:hypothetical protein